MNILLVEPDYYTRYPPLGLLKIASLEIKKGNSVKLIRGIDYDEGFFPDKIYITSLFTYSWKPVHSAIENFHKLFPKAEIKVGGIYATLMPNHITERFPFVYVHKGLIPEAENMLPSYYLLRSVEKWKNWKKSIVFTTRGCIRKCPFCVVPKIEGGMKEPKFSILPYIYEDHNEVVIWDNDFLASPYAKTILEELRDNGLRVDFNQGLDARLMTYDFANLLSDIKSTTIHMAYDWPWEGPYIEKAINMLGDAGYKRKNLIFYVLYNFFDKDHNKGDTPEDFLHRLQNLMNWGVSAYPMRYIPLDSLTRRGYISPYWSQNKLEMIADARRVLGHGGTFVNYRALADKFISASSFEMAMELWPNSHQRPIVANIY